MADGNPFGDSDDNPFAEPSIKAATLSSPGAQSYAFPKYEESTIPASTLPPPPRAASPVSSPAVLPAEPPPSYMDATSSPPTSLKMPSYGTSSPTKSPTYMPPSDEADLDRREAEMKQREELNRREQELQRREQALRSNNQSMARINNFPPLPKACPVHPCFFQDFDIDIPVEFQKLVKTMYYLWCAYVLMLLINVLMSLTYFITTMSANEKTTNSGVTFGISLLFLAIFTPCSFVCWYRPVYKAFKNDSSINFFVYFFIFFFQGVANCVLGVGFDGWGTVGLVSGLKIVTATATSMKVVGTLMIVVGIMFILLAVVDFFMMVRIHRVYRRTGASFEKAQQDLAKGVMSNKAVQNAAKDAAKDAVVTGVQSALSDAAQPNQGRY